MKKVLLGSTAIVGVAMLASVSALAAEKPTVSVSGYVDFQTGWFDQDAEGTGGLGGATDPGYGFITDSEVHIKASGEADNGLKYSAKIELESDQGTTGNADEVVLTISGNWGRIQLGAEDGAEDIMLGGHTGVGSAGSGGVDGDQSRWFLTTSSSTAFVDITDTSDAVKITYYTPRFNGFQFGASFTPDTGQTGKGAFNKLNGSLENHVGLGFNYVATHNDVDVAIEMHPNMLVYEPHGMRRLREETNERIGANFDPSHLHWQGISITDAIRYLGERGAIHHFHAKDTKVYDAKAREKGVLDTTAYTDEPNRSWLFRSIGYGHGESHWKDVVSTLRMVGYDDVLSIEHEDSLTSANEGLEKAVDVLDRAVFETTPGEAYWAE
ncbi:MAG: porin [Euryarchaeota archaeon]|nr:porin [Euryarchaeota archaeon]